MGSDELAKQLHDKATHGVVLSSDEQKQLVQCGVNKPTIWVFARQEIY